MNSTSEGEANKKAEEKIEPVRWSGSEGKLEPRDLGGYPGVSVIFDRETVAAVDWVAVGFPF